MSLVRLALKYLFNYVFSNIVLDATPFLRSQSDYKENYLPLNHFFLKYSLSIFTFKYNLTILKDR